jgi:hypothetical protein
MKVSRLATFVGRILALVSVTSAATFAQVTRKTVTVNWPVELPRRAAEIAIDAQAQRALIETVVDEKLSRELLMYRSTEIQSALQPLEAYATQFAVISRTPNGTRMNVLCEAEVDLGAILFALVRANVLTFGQDPPRVLLVPGPNTKLEGVKSIRARLRETLGGAGFQLLAIEDVASGFKPASPTQGDGINRQVAGARADVIAVVALKGAQVPSPVGGAVLDASLQFTVLRPQDNKILAEQAFSARGSGATLLAAEEAVYEELGPAMARALGAQLAAAVFAGTEVRDPTALAHATNIDVYSRPSPAATAALLAFLKQRDVRVSLASGGGLSSSANRTPVDRLVAEGSPGIADIYGWLTGAKFGPAEGFSAVVVAYGDGFVGVEILSAGATPKASEVSAPPQKPAEEAAPPTFGGPRPPLLLHRKIR